MNERQTIFNKYNGHCAYCGEDIKSNAFEVDHFRPLRRYPSKNKGSDGIENKMPACRKCNRAKRDYTIEEWRIILQDKIKELRRDSPSYCAAIRYRLVEETGKTIEFYFEQIAKDKLKTLKL